MLFFDVFSFHITILWYTHLRKQRGDFVKNKCLILLVSFFMFFIPNFSTAFSNNADVKFIDKEKVIITFKDKIDYEIINKYNGEVLNEYKNFPSITVNMPSFLVNDLKIDNLPNVLSIEKSIKVQLNEEYVDWGIPKTKTDVMWDSTYTGKDVKIAVIDSGIEYYHEDLNVVSGISFITEADGNTDYDDYNGHGTHVAGIIAGQHNGVGVKGVAPDSKIYAVKVFDESGTSDASYILQGIDWAITNNMDIISMSLGFQSGFTALEDAIQKAEDSGIIVVAASGNDRQGSISEGGCGGVDTNDCVDYPAAYPTTIAVGSIGDSSSYDNLSNFSSVGPAVDVIAPGYNIGSTYLNGTYKYLSGTSMATPYATGALALLKEKHPTKSHSELRQLLIDSAIDYGVAGKDNLFGNGLIQSTGEIKTSDSTPPSSPTGLSGVASDSQVSLSWNKNEEIDLKGYNIYRDGFKINSSIITTESYNVTGLTNDSTYNFSVTAVDDSLNESNKSNSISLTPVASDTTAPNNVTNIIEEHSSNSINLTWENPTESDFKHIEIFRDNQLIHTTTSNSYSDNDLIENTEYVYKLVSVDNSDNKSDGTSISITTDTATDSIPPNDVSNVTETHTDTSISLSWTNPTNSDLQHIEIFRDNQLIHTTTSDSYTDNNLVENTEYVYNLVSVDNSNNKSTGVTTRIKTNQTPDSTIPNAPTNLNALPDGAIIYLNWNENTESDLAGYNIYLNGNKTNSEIITKTSFSIDGLAQGITHTFTITALDTSGNESSHSNTSEAIINTQEPISNLSSDINNNSVTFNWENPLNNDFQHVSIYQNNQLITTTKLNTFTNTDLQYSTNYTYQFIAESINGLKSESVIKTVTIGKKPKPMAPTGLNYKKGTTFITLLWDSYPEEVLGYNIYKDGILYETFHKKETFTINDLSPSTQYTFSVSAINKYEDESDLINIQVTTLEEKQYEDLQETHWAYNDIQWVANKGWIRGMGINEFAPEDTLTRAQAAVILVRALELSAKNPINQSFDDVKSSHWAYKEIEIAKQYGIFGGVEYRKFAPNNPLTREQMAVVLHRVLGDGNITNTQLDSFTDMNNNEWSYESISIMKQRGIIGGYSDGSFKPKDDITRAQMSSLMKRSSDYFNDSSL